MGVGDSKTSRSFGSGGSGDVRWSLTAGCSRSSRSCCWRITAPCGVRTEITEATDDAFDCSDVSLSNCCS